jgi:hypothetical protein
MFNTVAEGGDFVLNGAALPKSPSIVPMESNP